VGYAINIKRCWVDICKFHITESKKEVKKIQKENYKFNLEWWFAVIRLEDHAGE